MLVPWHENRAAFDLLLGHVVRLGALPGVPNRQAVVVVLDAASGLERAARLDAFRQVEGRLNACDRCGVGQLLRYINRALRSPRRADAEPDHSVAVSVAHPLTVHDVVARVAHLCSAWPDPRRALLLEAAAE